MVVHNIQVTDCYLHKCHCPVRDVTWMSDQFVHLAEWMAALEQEFMELANCAKFKIALG